MSDLESQVEGLLRIFKLPPHVRELKFHPTRKWRFDFSWPAKKVALEIEGGIWSGGRHTRGAAFISDCDKYNAANLAGWRVYRVTTNHIKSGDVVDLMRQALA